MKADRDEVYGPGAVLTTTDGGPPMAARAKIASTTVASKKPHNRMMRRREWTMLHVGAMPISIEIRRARRDARTGNVLVLVETAKAKRPRSRRINKRG
jgi:hypothetical protein